MMENKKRKLEKLGDPENEEAFAHSAELMDYGGIRFYVPWDI